MRPPYAKKGQNLQRVQMEPDPYRIPNGFEAGMALERDSREAI